MKYRARHTDEAGGEFFGPFFHEMGEAADYLAETVAPDAARWDQEEETRARPDERRTWDIFNPDSDSEFGQVVEFTDSEAAATPVDGYILNDENTARATRALDAPSREGEA